MKRKLLTTVITVLFLSYAFGQEAGKKWMDVNYANDGQVYHNMDIHLPGNGAQIYQPIIIIYGSAWFANNMKGMAFNAMAKPLLEGGFAVISINHRSSGDAVYPAQINDVKAAIRFIRANAKKYQLDTTFIGITGFSSGGHLSSLAGTTNGVKTYTVGATTLDIEGTIGEALTYSSSVDAVVDWFGPIDMSLMDNCKGYKDASSPEAALIKGNPADHPEMMALVSPNTFIDKDDAPFLVIHGDADNVVNHCQSELFAAQLKEKGLLSEFISVPKGGHGPITFNPDTFQAMVTFFQKKSMKERGK